LSGMALTDSFQSGLTVAALPNIVSSCGGTVSAAAGATSVSLAGGAVAANASCSVKLDVTASVLGDYVGASGGVASSETGAPGDPSNAATLTVVATGVAVTGHVYADANHNLQQDGGEAGTGLALYAKLVPATGGPALAAVVVNASSGAYQFAAVPAGQYSVVIDNNAILADVTPAVPAGWLGTEAASFARDNVVVAGSAIGGISFGVFNGSRVSGRVFDDSGAGGGLANDAVQNGAETGIARAALRATDVSGTSIYDSVLTDGAGHYTLWIPAPAGAVNVMQAPLAGYVPVGGAAGSTGGAYSRATHTTTFAAVAGNVYSGVNFADVRENTLGGEGRQNAAPGGAVFYAHTFTPGTAGAVVFSTDAVAHPASGGFTQVLLRDANCNGQLDAGDPVLAPNTPIATQATVPVCVIVKDSVPGGAAQGATNVITLSADFAYANNSPQLLASYTRSDVTTVGAGSALALLKTQSTAAPLPGGTITYTIVYSNHSASTLSSIRVRDATPAYTRFVNALCASPLPAGITACTVTLQPAAGAVGSVEWSLTGSLSSAASGQVTFTVQVEQ